MTSAPGPSGAGSTADIDTAAIGHNVGLLADRAGDALVCAVVKADGYGHGAVPVARAALAAGATWLAVAHVGEAAQLRAAGIDVPVLVLSEPPPDDAVIDRALALRVDLTVYRPAMVELVEARAAALGIPDVGVHLKIDTGMRRVGCEPAAAVDVARRIDEAPHLRLAGTMTHLARADEPGVPTTDVQLDAFERAVTTIRAVGIRTGLVHAANSAATLMHPRARYDLVRTGIAVYGIPPAPVLAGELALRPALTWRSRVSFVKEIPAGDAVSYGHRHRVERATQLATVPVGYADGVARRLGLVGGQVLIGGRRRPIRGVVTMDQLVAEVDGEVAVGDEVVLLGPQGDEEITADEIGGWLDTIGYEVVCAISARVPRQHR